MMFTVALLLVAPAIGLLHHHARPVHPRPRVPAGVALSTNNITPLPRSKLIVGAEWTSPRYSPPKNQKGDILPTIWADDGNQYTLMDDGGTDVPVPGGLWRQSIARITGSPPMIRFTNVGDGSEPPPTIRSTYAGGPSGQPPSIASAASNAAAAADAGDGPLGPFYSSGLVEANHIFYATQENDWNWNANGTFTGLMGIADSRDRGAHWQFVYKPFPAPLGNLNWVIRGQGGVYADGYVYAIASEREFDASTLILGRSRPDPGDITDPSHWQWLTGWSGRGAGRRPEFSSSFADAVPILSWNSHITYPQMVYDAGLRRYLLTFTYSYVSTPPAVWQAGAELVITESPTPWGPFSLVAHDPDFGPSNGYGASFPVKWISPDGRDLWLKWSANFDGCAPALDCTGGYGFNYRRIHLTLAGDR